MKEQERRAGSRVDRESAMRPKEWRILKTWKVKTIAATHCSKGWVGGGDFKEQRRSV